MRLFQKVKDGGPKSTVDAYFLIESKRFGSVALLKFNEGGREEYHTHAFNALTWFLKGNMLEQKLGGVNKWYKRSLLPKFTSKKNNHRVWAVQDSWCFTLRGPWQDTWTEDDPRTNTHTVFTHGRRVIDE